MKFKRLTIVAVILFIFGCGRDEFGAKVESGGEVVEVSSPRGNGTNNGLSAGGADGDSEPSPEEIENIRVGDLSTFDIFRAALESEAEPNVVIHPIGINASLVALHLAASSETKEILGKQIGFVEGETYDAFARYLGTNERSNVAVTGLWIDENFPPNQPFVDEANRLLNLDVRALSFSPTDDPRSEINGFVRRTSNGFLDDTISPGTIDPGTFLIVGAQLFESVWETPFEPDRTTEVVFGESGSATMMFQTGIFPVYDTATMTAVSIALDDDQEALFIAPKIGEMDGLLTELDEAFVTSLRNTMITERVDLGLPKFDVRHTLQMSNLVDRIGSEYLFDSATFDDLSSAVELGDVHHETRIIVDEVGIVSGERDPDFSNDTPENGLRSVVLNRPFLFMTIDKTTGDIRTIGRVTAP